MSQPRMTIPTQRVLRALVQQDDLYGAQVGQLAGLASGTVHPILARLEGLGWLESSWEDVDPREAGRPARRFYRLSPDGRERARDGLARAYRAPRPLVAGSPVVEER